jgi:hypothetical protein
MHCLLFLVPYARNPAETEDLEATAMQFGRLQISFFEGMAKALPLFILDDEKEKQVWAQFFEWKLGPKTTLLGRVYHSSLTT